MSARFGWLGLASALWCGSWLVLSGLSLARVWGVVAVLCLVCVIAGSMAPRGKRPILGVALAVAGLVLGAGLAAMRLAPFHDSTLNEWAQHRLPVTAVVDVSGEPTSVSGYTRGSFRRPDGWRVSAQLVLLQTTLHRSLVTRVPVDVRGSGRVPTFIPGTTLRLIGSVGATDQTRGNAVLVRARSVAQIRPPPTWQRVVSSIRLGLVTASSGLPGDARGLLPGLTLGDTRNVTPDLVAAMKQTGLTHLTAVSGGNLAVTLALVLGLSRLLRWSRRWQAASAVVVLAAFVALVHAEPSVLRAAVMAAIGLLAFVLQRPRAAVATLSASVVVLLLVDPWLARSWGFALSAAATGGLLVLAGPLTKSLRRWLPNTIAVAIGVAVAAQLATAPLIAALAGGVPLASIPANVLAVPAAGPATVAGLAVAALQPLWHPLAIPPLLLGGAAAWWIATVAHVCAGLGLPVIGAGSGAVGAFAMLGALAGGAALVATRARWVPLLPAFVRLHTRITIAIVTSVALLLWVVVPRVSRALDGWPPTGWVAVMCDVGQGDGLVLATTAHHAIVVDSGPEPKAIDRCLSDLGIDTVDFVVLTHFHADHVEGLSGVLSHRHVGYIVVTGLADPPDEAVRVSALAAKAGVPVRTIVNDWHGVDGQLTWQTLWPLRYIKGQGSDPNNASIVLLVHTHGVAMLLTGDVEPPAQEAIEQTWGSPHVDVLKVPHHGSSHQDAAFAAWSGAHLALISVGAGNPYGHPAPETLAALARAHIAFARTDQAGDIAVLPAEHGAALVRRRRTGVARSPT